MAKLRPEPIEEADISQFLRELDDFQFEIDIFRLCQTAGLDTIHGGTYEDPVTKKDRQFDIRAEITKASCVLKLAIECKHLKLNHPLLVSRVPRLRNESFHEILLPSVPQGSSLFSPPIGIEKVPIKKCTQSHSIFPVGEMVGKSTVQIGRTLARDLSSADSDVYEKWAQAIASTYDLVGKSGNEHEKISKRAAAVLVLPILVVADDTLWVADYSAMGALIAPPRRENECTLYLGKEVAGKYLGVSCTLSHLLIFTRTGFHRFTELITANDHHWYKLFPGLYDQ